MSWTAALSDATALERIYKGGIPELSGVRVHQLAFKRDGPQLVVHFDLPAYPVEPPAKWRAQGFNTVQLEVSFVGVRSVQLEGFGTDPVADIEIVDANPLQVRFDSDQFQMELTAVGAMLLDVSAYLDT